MARRRRAITLGAATAAAFALVVPAASAATTTIRQGTATAAPYAGNIRATLIGVATVSSSLGSGSCDSSVMNGSIQSDGTALTINSATFTGAGGGPCSGATSATITSQNLPWTGGNVTYAPVAGGRDATATIANFRVKAVLSIGITCTYGGNLTASGYNPTNPSRPATGVAQAQVAVVNSPVSKVSPSSFLCPGSAQVTANYQLQGETTPGNFNQTLFVTS